MAGSHLNETGINFLGRFWYREGDYEKAIFVRITFHVGQVPPPCVSKNRRGARRGSFRNIETQKYDVLNETLKGKKASNICILEETSI
jgi:hypothetical protein